MPVVSLNAVECGPDLRSAGFQPGQATTTNNRYLFRDTMLKLIDSLNLEYKHVTAKIEEAA